MGSLILAVISSQIVTTINSGTADSSVFHSFYEMITLDLSRPKNTKNSKSLSR